MRPIGKSLTRCRLGAMVRVERVRILPLALISSFRWSLVLQTQFHKTNLLFTLRTLAGHRGGHRSPTPSPRGLPGRVQHPGGNNQNGDEAASQNAGGHQGQLPRERG